MESAPGSFGAHETNNMGSHVEVEVLWDKIVNLYPQWQQLSQRVWRWKPQDQNHVRILQPPRMTSVPPLWSKRSDQQCLFHMHYQSSDMISPYTIASTSPMSQMWGYILTNHEFFDNYSTGDMVNLGINSVYTTTCGCSSLEFQRQWMRSVLNQRRLPLYTEPWKGLLSATVIILQHTRALIQWPTTMMCLCISHVYFEWSSSYGTPCLAHCFLCCWIHRDSMSSCGVLRRSGRKELYISQDMFLCWNNMRRGRRAAYKETRSSAAPSKRAWIYRLIVGMMLKVMSSPLNMKTWHHRTQGVHSERTRNYSL